MLSEVFEKMDDNREGEKKYIYKPSGDKLQFFKPNFDIDDMIQSEPKLKKIFSEVSDLNFNVFDLQRETQNNELFFICNYIMTREGLY